MTEDALRIAIAGGGTGGHVQPAVAVAQALRSRANVKFLWIGSANGYEVRAARAVSIPLKSIQTGKLRRYLSLQTPIDALRIPVGILQAARALRSFRPDVVFSTGGFVSVPTVIAARFLGYPILSHEQTAVAGLANRINARFADVMAVSYSESAREFSNWRAKVTVTGNPVRPEILTGNCERGREQFGLSGELPVIYITGGTLGAHVINQTVSQIIPSLVKYAQIVHQCGPRETNGDYDRLIAMRNTLVTEVRSRYVVRELIGEELPHLFAAAQIVIGRAGASTVAELAALGKPAILIPLPGTGGDEQTRNAKVLEKAGAAIMIPQQNLTAPALSKTIRELLENTDKLDQMKSSAKSIAHAGADHKLAEQLLLLAGKTHQADQ